MITTRQLIEGYKELLDRYQWSWFGTFTFREYPPLGKARKIFDRWLGEIEKKHGTSSFAGFASPNDEFLSLQRAESSSHDSRGLRIDGAERRNFISFCKPTSDSVRSDFCTVHPRTDLHPNTLKRYAICQRVLAQFFGAARRGMITVVESKTPAGLRMIPMTSRLQNELAQWKRQTGSTSQYVFFNPRNPATNLFHVPKTWARALKEAGVAKRRLYDCRSTFCSRM